MNPYDRCAAGACAYKIPCSGVPFKYRIVWFSSDIWFLVGAAVLRARSALAKEMSVLVLSDRYRRSPRYHWNIFFVSGAVWGWLVTERRRSSWVGVSVFFYGPLHLWKIILR